MRFPRQRRPLSLPTTNGNEEVDESNIFRPSLVELSSRRAVSDRSSISRNRQAKLLLRFLINLLAVVFLVKFGRRLSPLSMVQLNHDSVAQILPPEANHTTVIAQPTTPAVTRSSPSPTFGRHMETTRPPPRRTDDRKVSSSCSCWDVTAPPECCERTIFRAHKFGTILVDTLFDSFRHSTSNLRIDVQQLSKWNKPLQPLHYNNNNATTTTGSDYRHVLVTRNWFDAIVSGYLYHKAGHECWLNAQGIPKRIVRREDDWDKHLTTTTLYEHQGAATNRSSFPPRNGRSICLYLKEESVEDGIKVVMDLAISKWYKDVVPYWNYCQEQLQRRRDDVYSQEAQHSLFVCYEDLVDPFRRQQVIDKILDWLFPAGEAKHITNAKERRSRRTVLQEGQTNETDYYYYSGGHATTRNPKVRGHLKRLVERFDRELFNGTIASSNAIFGCGH